MNRFDSPRIWRAAILGGIAGLLSFVIQEPRSRASELSHSQGGPGSVFAEALLMFALLGLLIGAALAIADEVGSTSGKRFLHRLAIGAVAGGACGAVAGLIGQAIYSILLGGMGQNIFTLVMARTIGWAAVGAGTGVAGGLPSLSLRKCLQGFVGGLMGGAAGGMLFDAASIPFRSGTASRLIGDVAIGLCVGAAVMLVEEMAKVAWVTVVAGRNEGKQYILSKPVTTIGRDELSDIPLYGDANVVKQHATIRTTDGKQFSLCDSGSPMGSGVNGVRVAQQALRDHDAIQIGGFQLIFSHRSGQMPVQAAQFSPAAPYSGPVQNQPVCPFCGQQRNPMSGMCACTPVGAGGASPVRAAVKDAFLVGVTGPYLNTRFALDRERIEIGRDASNDITLDQDGGVSRKHALIIRENGALVMYDNGSTNGTFVNGARVQRAVLNPGDVVHMGGSSFEFGGQ